eukprot:gene11615-46967_t
MDAPADAAPTGAAGGCGGGWSIGGAVSPGAGAGSTPAGRAAVLSALLGARDVVCASVHSPLLYAELLDALPPGTGDELRQFSADFGAALHRACGGARGVSEFALAAAGADGGLIFGDTALLADFLSMFPPVADFLHAALLRPPPAAGGSSRQSSLRTAS